MHEQVSNYFIKKLEEVGFPEDSIASEYRIDNASSVVYIDIAIIEPITNEVLVIFEIKVGIPKGNILESAKKQLSKCIDFLPNKNIPAYIVFIKNNEDFEIFSFGINEDGSRVLSEAIRLENIISYKALSNRSKANTIKEKSLEIKNTTGRFKIVCRIFAVILIVLAFLDNIKLISISNTQLTLIGIAIALAIMPFSKKLKILGVEFERLIEEKKCNYDVKKGAVPDNSYQEKS